MPPNVIWVFRKWAWIIRISFYLYSFIMCFAMCVCLCSTEWRCDCVRCCQKQILFSFDAKFMYALWTQYSCLARTHTQAAEHIFAMEIEENTNVQNHTRRRTAFTERFDEEKQYSRRRRRWWRRTFYPEQQLNNICTNICFHSMCVLLCRLLLLFSLLPMQKCAHPCHSVFLSHFFLHFLFSFCLHLIFADVARHTYTYIRPS